MQRNYSRLLCLAVILPLICQNGLAQSSAQKHSLASLFEDREIDREILNVIGTGDDAVAVESRDSDYLAAVQKDNSINLYFNLHLTKKAVSRNLKGHDSTVYSLCFSPDSNFLASTDISGNVNLWNTNNGELISSFSGIYAKQNVNLDFTYDGTKLIAPTGRNSFGVFNFKGKKLVSIFTRENIKKLKTITNSSAVAVLTESDRLEIYNAETGRWLGKDISEVKFIFKNPVEKETVTKTADIQASERKEIPQAEKITDTDSIYRNILENSEETENDNELNEEEDDETDSGEDDHENLLFLKKSRMNLISFQGGTSWLSSPYSFSADLNVEYRYSSRISPFFCGVGLNAKFGFPGKDFDSTYTIDGKTVQPPYLLAGTLYMPLGIIFSPWQNRIYIITELKAGVRVQSLALLDQKNYVIGQPYASGFISAGIGFLFDHFEININCDFDTIGRISPSAYAGFNLIFGER